jgi:DNA-binding NarL/FixJ family response regulator
MTIESAAPKLLKNNILIVDDHPLLYKGTKMRLQDTIQRIMSFFITEAKDCESAYNVITNPESDVLILLFRHKYAAHEDKGIYSGEDLAKLLWNICRIAKLFYLQCSLSFIKNNHKKYKLNGLVIKNDLTFDELLFAFDKVIKNETYYSQSVIKMLDSQDKRIEIDLFDKQILFIKGTKSKDITQYIPISINAIEVRKSNLKELLK